MSTATTEELQDLVAGTLDPERVRELQAAAKDPQRRARIIEIWQARVPWKEKILLCLQESLFVVQTSDGKHVRCQCGHNFGNYKVNWKESALVYQRDPEAGELFAPASAPTREWMVLREFYCPGCATLLDTENVPQGYPFIFNFLPHFADEAAD